VAARAGRARLATRDYGLPDTDAQLPFGLPDAGPIGCFGLSLTQGVPHMPTAAVYGALVGFAVLRSWLGIQGFTKRVLA